MKFNIPKYLHIRWQAALAVLEDLQEDVNAPFRQNQWADNETLWEKTNGCSSAACFAGYISVAPYCKVLGLPTTRGAQVANWLLPNEKVLFSCRHPLYRELFHEKIDKGSRAKTLAFLEQRIKQIFKDSTGKKLVAPLTFYY